MNNFYELVLHAKQHQEQLQKKAEHYRQVQSLRVKKAKKPLFRKLMRNRQKPAVWYPLVIPKPAFKD